MYKVKQARAGESPVHYGGVLDGINYIVFP